MKKRPGFFSLLAAAAAVAVPPALADEEGTILALGDSVAFGYITLAGFQYVNPDNFVAYPQYLGVLRHVHTVDAACPGETTGSFLSSIAVDHGCREYRAAAPLHVSYGSTQLQFATSYLRLHHNVRVVTLQLGANDEFVLLDSCASAPNPALWFNERRKHGHRLRELPQRRRKTKCSWVDTRDPG